MEPIHPDKLEALERMEALMNEESFLVLVWGSGDGAGEDYKKRRKLRDHLENTLGTGRVFFSEDDAFKELVKRRGAGVAEGLEAFLADAVVILDTSIGAHTEIMKFESILREKAIVFVREEYRKGPGFAAVAYDILKTETYNGAEYTDCSTIRRLANSFVQSLLFRKVRGKLVGCAAG